jgi:hypothetical protein
LESDSNDREALPPIAGLPRLETDRPFAHPVFAFDSSKPVENLQPVSGSGDKNIYFRKGIVFPRASSNIGAVIRTLMEV